MNKWGKKTVFIRLDGFEKCRLPRLKRRWSLGDWRALPLSATTLTFDFSLRCSSWLSIFFYPSFETVILFLHHFTMTLPADRNNDGLYANCLSRSTSCECAKTVPRGIQIESSGAHLITVRKWRGHELWRPPPLQRTWTTSITLPFLIWETESALAKKDQSLTIVNPKANCCWQSKCVAVVAEKRYVREHATLHPLPPPLSSTPLLTVVLSRLPGVNKGSAKERIKWRLKQESVQMFSQTTRSRIFLMHLKKIFIFAHDSFDKIEWINIFSESSKKTGLQRSRQETD